MTEPTITLAVWEADADNIGRWWAPVAARWPAHAAPPSPRLATLDLLIDELANTEANGLTPETTAMIVLGPGTPMVSAVQLVDALQRALVPAVLLFPELDGPRQRLQGGGVIIEEHSADPAYLAALLFALSERQSTVRTLARDLQIAARYEGGVRGEIDRIHDELNLAAAVQQDILPKRLPAIDGVECGVLFRPVGYVSGDIYDIAPIDEHRLAFFLADAVGHGVPAALLTMVISRSLRLSHAGSGGLRPGEALARLNDDLIRGQRGGPARFATAVCGIIDGRSRQVTIAGAGHPPPLRVRRGSVRKVETDGPLLGVFPGEVFGETTFTLAEGETLLMYSDGFETAFPGREFHGQPGRRANDRYLDQLAALSWPDRLQGGTLAAAMDELALRLDEQAGSLHQIDDLTALAICSKLAAAAKVGNLTARAA